MPHLHSTRVGTGLPALSPTPVSGEMRDDSLYESLQGLGVQEPEYEMRHPYGMKTLQLLDYFCAASGHEVLLRAAHHLIGVFGDAGCTQIRQFDLRRVPALLPATKCFCGLRTT